MSISPDLTDVAASMYDYCREEGGVFTREIEKRTIGEMSGTNMELIGSGGARRVYGLPADTHTYQERCVVKVPMYGQSIHSDGVLQNRVEVETYRNHQHEDLVPVFESNPEYFWVVMPYASPLADSELDEYGRQRVVGRLERRLDGIVSPHDISERNIGWYCGGWRVLDYGFCPNQ